MVEELEKWTEPKGKYGEPKPTKDQLEDIILDKSLQVKKLKKENQLLKDYLDMDKGR